MWIIDEECEKKVEEMRLRCLPVSMTTVNGRGGDPMAMVV
jgi:hypothetical protein